MLATCNDLARGSSDVQCKHREPWWTATGSAAAQGPWMRAASAAGPQYTWTRPTPAAHLAFSMQASASLQSISGPDHRFAQVCCPGSPSVRRLSLSDPVIGCSVLGFRKPTPDPCQADRPVPYLTQEVCAAEAASWTSAACATVTPPPAPCRRSCKCRRAALRLLDPQRCQRCLSTAESFSSCISFLSSAELVGSRSEGRP